MPAKQFDCQRSRMRGVVGIPLMDMRINNWKIQLHDILYLLLLK
ncbi:hypothetical protein [Acinetobacter thermotolerans]